LANTTAVAMENVQLYGTLERRVKERTAQLEAANRELEAYSYAVSHDLGAPLRSIRGYAEALTDECAANLDSNGKSYVEKMTAATRSMRRLIDDLLRLSKVARGEFNVSKVNLSEMAQSIVERLSAETPERQVEMKIVNGIQVEGDLGLLRIAIENLLSNAWKYTNKTSQARVEFGISEQPDGTQAYFVRDNG